MDDAPLSAAAAATTNSGGSSRRKAPPRDPDHPVEQVARAIRRAVNARGRDKGTAASELLRSPTLNRWHAFVRDVEEDVAVERAALAEELGEKSEWGAWAATYCWVVM